MEIKTTEEAENRRKSQNDGKDKEVEEQREYTIKKKF